MPDMDGLELILDPLGPRFRSEADAAERVNSFINRNTTKPWSVFDNSIPVYVQVAESAGMKTMVNPDYTNAPFEILFYRTK